MTYRLKVKGDTDSTKLLLPTARKELAILTEQMKFGNLGQNQRTTILSSGAVIHVDRVLGQDTISIEVPEVEAEVVEEEKEEELTLEYRLQLTNTVDNLVVGIDRLSRFALYKEDATSLVDEDYIVFDYLVPSGTDPEVFFGSSDNPGLQWDDANEYFFVESRDIDDVDFVALDFGALTGLDGPKFFMVFSCVNDEGEISTENQQYKSIQADENRWLEADLVVPAEGDEYYEDLIQCGGQYYVVATWGTPTRVVIWDASIRRFAQGIIDDNTNLIEDADWPVLYSDLGDWYSDTSNAGYPNLQRTDFNCAGAGMTYVGCAPWLDPMNCTCSSKEEEGVLTCRSGYTDYMYSECEQLEVDYEYHYTETIQRYAAVQSFKMGESGLGTINGFDVRAYWTQLEEKDRYSYSKGFVITTDYEYSREHNIDTPWGKCYASDFFGLDRDEHSHWVQTPYERVCSGDVLTSTDVWLLLDDDERNTFIGFKTNNILFIAVYGWFQGEVFPWQDDDESSENCERGDGVEQDIIYGAVGTMGYYETSLLGSIDPNEMPACDDIAVGIKALMEAEFTANGTSSIKTLSFTIREDD